ncbi:MAG: glycosyltransferase family 4 protein [Candidatus Omnitrophica bacterium]|nr:glycosyltransferase family 4 protein [Candidatus Omnitrophota bacterium]
MRKVKVLRIIARLNIGGPAQHVVFLSEGLPKERYDSVLVYGSLDAGEGDMSYLLDRQEIRRSYIPAIVRRIDPIRDIIALCKLIAIMRRERPDIVHTHTAKAGTLGRIAAFLTGVPLRVHTFHGHVLHGYFNRFLESFFLACERALAGITDRIVVVSDRQLEELTGTYRIGERDKYSVISLGFELEKFLDTSRQAGRVRARYGIAADAIVVGIVGRLVPVKNHALLVDAAARLQGMLPAPLKERVIFLVIGDGALRDTLAASVKEKGLEKRFIFTGWVAPIEEAYADIDIVALTSRNEGTPLSLIEALAAGRPVIATDVGGVADTLGGNGILVNDGDALVFAQRLRELIINESLRAELGRIGREHAIRRFSKQRLIDTMDRLYSQLIQEKGITL